MPVSLSLPPPPHSLPPLKKKKDEFGISSKVMSKPSFSPGSHYICITKIQTLKQSTSKRPSGVLWYNYNRSKGEESQH